MHSQQQQQFHRPVASSSSNLPRLHNPEPSHLCRHHPDQSNPHSLSFSNSRFVNRYAHVPLLTFLGPECYTHLVYDLQVDHIICLKFGISRALSLAIVLGSAIVKIPQIPQIFKSQSARGLSLSSFILNTLGLIIIMGYNYRHDFPTSTYGQSSYFIKG
ncbi:uncharacterized protein MELLADRAFT_88385 [Melampsora larici-populina 98AG31]|uniref:Uncharacterized protein n=1 Tax=Melampsora larici-populina (strain 98AG31 / pathotype 3-4-7) TaxID=747676 RepID=F4RRJ0_MELLP|nr:uncharacterized protein MELLADRAFT_88385 [Melampsora larici-populina 98AG31]EGG05019.1 hypothetical protein MELLADRAFT_88385 [Melampsora larici-populina 98AG31]